MIRQKQIFITGIAGFIGYHLASFLQKRGDYVIGCDNFNDYYSPDLKRKRAEMLREQGVEILDLDIRNLKQHAGLLKKKKISHVVHLAAQAGVRYSIENPRAYLDANIDGFLEVLELCRHHTDVNLIFASSSSVYGKNKKVPFTETDKTDHQVSLYGATKKAGESLAFSYHHLYGIPMVGLRFFTVYGPWGRPDMAYYSFAKAIQEEKPIHVFNHGKMKRDFTYIADIVQGTVQAIDRTKKDFQIYNLGNHKSEELMTLISLLEEKLEKKAIIEFKPMQMGDVVDTFADIAKAEKDLGFNPKTSLKEGISHFIEWYLKQSPFIR